MALAATSHHSFIKGNLHSPIRKSPRRTSHLSLFSCKASLERDEQSSSNKSQFKLVKLAAVTLAAGVLALGSVDGAMAAKSGGRVGGQAFRSAPRSSGPRINNSRTNIFINPPVAPPLIGGYGYGGGYGWSPFSYFVPGPSVAVGVGGGLDIFFWFIILGTISAVFRRFFGRRDDDFDDYDD
ncbi:transmembrane protein [Rhynchospora pubera]|uniref:Transmembrane protein n=1 Tax=Rhynchospora pubera TaxID=906938 RepID=A0AAV8HMS3_9POAL|nr:transmembrane protein [Rhynchospora pubera]